MIQQPVIRQPHRQGRVLLADDDASVRRGVSLVLSSAGFEVEGVTCASEVIEALSRQSYDACVADIHMPGNEQLELVEAVRSVALVPLVLITGKPSVVTAVTALRGGVFDYIVKPFRPEELLMRLETVVAKGRELRASAQMREHVASLVEAASRVVDSAGPLTNGRQPQPVASGEHRVEDENDVPPWPSDLVDCLSPRQLEVVRLLAMGHPIPEVAELLGLSVHTVRGHMKSIFMKLGVQTQVALLGKLAGHSVPRNRRH